MTKPLPFSEAFNAVTHQPAWEFERANDVKGIAGRYVIPDGMTAYSYERRMLRSVKKNLAQSWRKLRLANPELSRIRIDKTDAFSVYDAHMGVTSGFNIDDINFFMALRQRIEAVALYVRSSPVHGARLERIDAICRARLQWVPSPKTARKMEKLLLQRGALG